MAVNPNPTRITDACWRLWEESLLIIPGVRLGGIYANKSGYHNYVLANQANWPNNYSIRLTWDLQGDLTKARAIDLTMSTAEMTKRTGYLKAAAQHPEDNRLSACREFYGTLNGTVVYGLIHDGPGLAWRSSTSDSSHLWHIHISFFTLYCDDWAADLTIIGLEAVLSVLSGESWESWVARKSGGDDMALKVVQTKDVNGDTIFMYPWNGTWRRIPKSTNPWVLQNALDALTKAGLSVDTSWPGPYDFSDPGIQASWGYEVLPEGQLSDAALAEVKAAAEAGAEAGAPTEAELVDAAKKGANLAEDE